MPKSHLEKCEKENKSTQTNTYTRTQIEKRPAAKQTNKQPNKITIYRLKIFALMSDL